MFPFLATLGKAALSGATAGLAGSTVAGSTASLIGQGLGSMAHFVGKNYAGGVGARAFAKGAKVPSAVTAGSYLNSPMMSAMSTSQVQNQKELLDHKAEKEVQVHTQKALVDSKVEEVKRNQFVENLTGITLGKKVGEALGNIYYMKHSPVYADRFKSRSNSLDRRRRRRNSR